MRIPTLKNFLSIAAVLGLFGLGIYMNMGKPASFQRGIASVDSKVNAFDSLKYKTELISKILWKESEAQVQLNLNLGELDCSNFSSGKIFLRPDGLSEDGEVSSFSIPLACQKGQFSLDLPSQLSEIRKVSKEKPDFFEDPESLFVSKIEIEGLSGKMEISSYELQSILGQQLIIHLKK